MVIPNSCPVCNNTENIRTQDKVLQVFVCSRCGHEFSKNNVDPNSIYVSEYFSEVHKNWFLHPNFKLFDSIASLIKDGGFGSSAKVMDIGCGTGDLLKYLKKQESTWQLYGVDVSDNTLSEAVYMRGDFVSMSIEQKFDVVTGLMVIEHVPDPIAFVKKIDAIVSDKGKVFLVTVNSGGLMYTLTKLFRILGWRGPYDRLYHHHHLQHFNTTSLRCLMEQNGFKVIKQSTHNFPLSAVDLPKSSKILAFLYKYAIAIFFGLTAYIGGVNQTIICEKKS